MPGRPRPRPQFNRGKKKPGQMEERRLVLPRPGEFVGVVTKALGASKFSVFCSDNVQRVCAIPGRLKRQFWIKENDIVLVKPWVVMGDTKGDVIYRYSMMDRENLKQKGFVVPQI